MRKCLVAVLVTALSLPMAVPAMAHVMLNPREASKGGFAKFDVRVPNERDDANTVKVEIEIPQDHPITSVSVAPVPGWTYEVERSKLATPLEDDDGNTISEAVSKVSWEGGQIKPGEFVEFPVSMGPLPEDADSLTFKAIQTYSSGEVVRWIEIREEGKPEPDHPAPLVKLVSAGGGTAAAPTPSPTATAAATEASGTMGDKTGIILGVIAIVLSLVALLRSGRSSGRKAAA